ncbi:MAG: hypothetical protein BroJett040_12980 [Oligoflexia bacterium]|nr:MAG: hypothetical protein BroJett040_12980 [Oligoflexia bacterium]
MSQKTVTSALIFVLCSALIAFAYIARKPLCIDSKIVEKIDRVSVEATSEAYRCGLGHHVPFDEKLYSILPDLARRLSHFERLFEDVSPLKYRIQISLLEGDRDRTYKVQDHHIFLGTKLLQQPGVLEKAVIKVWLQEKIAPAVLAVPTFEGIFEDLYYNAVTGEKTTTQSRWPFVLKNLRSYCRSATLAPEHIATCSQANEGQLQSDLEIVLPSLRPLITESLVSAYSQLNAEERIQLLHGLLAEAQQWKTQKKEIVFSSALMHEQVYLAAQEVEMVLDNLLRWGRDIPTLLKLGQLFEQELGLRGYSQSGAATYVDYIFIPQDGLEFSKEFTTDLSAAADRRPGLMAALFVGNKLQFLPNLETIDQALFSNIRAHRAVLLSCEVPSHDKLLFLAKKSEKLLVVHQCLELEKLKFNGYFSHGIEGFARENPNVSFIQLHMPSLLQAWHSGGANPLPLIMSQNWRDPFFQKLGWQTPRWDQQLKIYKPQSAIEAVEAYRLKPSL